MEVTLEAECYYVTNKNGSYLEQIPRVIAKKVGGMLIDGHDDDNTLARLTGLTVLEIEQAKEFAFKDFLRNR